MAAILGARIVCQLVPFYFLLFLYSQQTFTAEIVLDLGRNLGSERL